eukprot:TRINITY_DN9756_c0_g1_i1.p1 TRINITY_DN9756_c0_g1~~TRINITY_DN9756_c0_g1_i1.p1  ORF type:complete len:428 (+),score=42.58 TRINITY_DN9756_c0_g1_i1:255-1538(+)
MDLIDLPLDVLKVIFDNVQLLNIRHVNHKLNQYFFDEYMKYHFIRFVSIENYINCAASWGKHAFKGSMIMMSYCYFYDADTLLYLKSAKEIYFHLCHSEDDIFDCNMRYMRGVKGLHFLFSGKLTDLGMKYFGHVQEINLNHCENFTDKGLYYLKNAKKVSLVGCCQITDYGLSYLTNATHINIRSCPLVTNSGLKYLKNVKSIDLSYCTNISDIKYISKVEYINLKSTGIKDKGLKKLEYARIIDLSNTTITSKGLKYLKNAKIINLYNCENITDIGLKYMANAHSLNIKKCKNITDVGLEYLRRVKILKIGHNSKISDIGISCLLHLEAITIKDMPNVTGECFSGLSLLKYVYLYRSSINDIMLGHLEHIPNIKFKLCHDITEYGTSVLHNSELDIQYCYGITNDGKYYYNSQTDSEESYNDPVY